MCVASQQPSPKIWIWVVGTCQMNHMAIFLAIMLRRPRLKTSSIVKAAHRHTHANMLHVESIELHVFMGCGSWFYAALDISLG